MTTPVPAPTPNQPAFEVRGSVVRWTVDTSTDKEIKIDGKSIEAHSMHRLPDGDVVAIADSGLLVNLSKGCAFEGYGSRFSAYSMVTAKDGRVLAHAHPHTDRDPMILDVATGNAVFARHRADESPMSTTSQMIQGPDGFTYAVMQKHNAAAESALVCLDTGEVVKTLDGKELMNGTLGIGQIDGYPCFHNYLTTTYRLEGGKAVIPSEEQARGGVVMLPSYGPREGNRVMGNVPGSYPIPMIPAEK